MNAKESPTDLHLHRKAEKTTNVEQQSYTHNCRRYNIENLTLIKHIYGWEDTCTSKEGQL